jgi:hypothetical protein
VQGGHQLQLAVLPRPEALLFVLEDARH